MIAIDNVSSGVSTLEGAHGGMRSYLRDLCRGLPWLLPGERFALFTPEWNPLLAAGEAPPNLRVVRLAGTPRNRLLRAAYEQCVLPWIVAREGVRLWIGAVNVTPLAAPCRRVTVLQSHQYLTDPGAYSWTRRVYLSLLGRASALRSHRVVTLSHDSARVVCKRWGLDRERVRVIYNRVPADVAQVEDRAAYAAARRALRQGRPYILCVSAFYPYKNLERLVQAFGRAAGRIPHDLVLAGRETEEISAGDVRRWANAAGVEERVLIRGRLERAELQACYAEASLVAMPSLSETFGLPIVEGMWYGVPVLTSGTGTTAEISGDAALLVDPLDVDSIAGGLVRGVSDRGLRAALVEAGRRRRQDFTTEAMLAGFAALVRELTARDGAPAAQFASSPSWKRPDPA